MENFELWARPWWVNLLVVIPVVAFVLWKKTLQISHKTLVWSGLFGAAFGFVESSVVVYLRGAIGLLGQTRTLLPSRMIDFDVYRQSHLLNELPKYLLTVELYREVATMVMLVSVAVLAAKKIPEQLAIFFWAFALWDIFYYVGLKISIGWPNALTDQDVLFLLPVPWFAQIWFPLFVSSFFLLIIFFSRTKQGR